MQSDWQEREPSEQQEWPEDIVALLQRTINYPRDMEGTRLLAQSLAEAAQKSGVSMRAIVDRCRETSQYCPTDFDLFSIARDLKTDILKEKHEAEQRKQQEEWRRQYGKAKPFSMDTKKGACGCCGRQWTEILSTHRKRDAEMWSKVWERIGGPKNSRHMVRWSRIYRVMKDLGYKLTREQEKMMDSAEPE